MSPSLLYAAGGIMIFFIGLHALLVHRHLLRKILAVNIMGSGVFLVFIALGSRASEDITDPVPQAMVLTGIVVALCFTAVALALAVRIHSLTGCTTFAQDQEPSGD